MKEIILIGLILITMLIFTVCESPPNEYVGYVKDFQVSAGGWGSDDKASVTLDNGEKVLITGGDVFKLRTGAKVCRVGGIYQYFITTRECN